jgi:hypothetical protein
MKTDTSNNTILWTFSTLFTKFNETFAKLSISHKHFYTNSSLVYVEGMKGCRRSQWPRGLRRRSAAERLLGSWIWIPLGGMDVCLLWVFVLSGRGLCDGPIPRPDESYRLWCVSECDQVGFKPTIPASARPQTYALDRAAARIGSRRSYEA